MYYIQGVRFVSNYILYRYLLNDGVYCAWSSRGVPDKQEGSRLLHSFVVVHLLGVSVRWESFSSLFLHRTRH